MKVGSIAKNKNCYFLNPLFFKILASFTGELTGEFWGSPVKSVFPLKNKFVFLKITRGLYE
jgi:hypothetical protein